MFVSEALAQTAGTAAPASPLGDIGFFVPLILVFIVMWFFMIRPQQKKQKAHQAMIRAAKRGDRIVTSGGIVGTITKANDADNDVEVEIAKDVKIRVMRHAIADIVNRNPEAAKTVAKDAAKDTKEGANDA
ncbi:preprotein translocase subunit YajC [Dongia sedimenti]|uniref:Sec translocon accessory complex subunit YajC n=1 Tax=Dongia sedimenti TaxID=3064282 RepID=A0ABU0YI07_9PROT|nr:preprotein translocase subunit YajC [Rhodospirillaceae bacterium R-7]